MVFAADCMYAARCGSDDEVRRRGGDPDQAWYGCLLEADFQDHVRALVRAFANSSDEGKAAKRGQTRRKHGRAR